MPDDLRDPRTTFSGAAEKYLASTDHRSGADLQVIRHVAAHLFPAVTVDVATGAGHALRTAAPFSGYCIATDLTAEMLHVAKEHLTGVGFPDSSYVQSSADRLPLADGCVSLLTCRIAPHHFPSIPDFLEEIVRVLGPDGQAVIVDSVVPDGPEMDRFINDVEEYRDPSHVRSHTLDEWLEMFKGAGLVAEAVELFERTHIFREWASRTGLDDEGVSAVEKMFLDAPEDIRERFRVLKDSEGKVESYTDEKGIFVVRKGKG